MTLIARSGNNVAQTLYNHTILLPTNETSHNTDIREAGYLMTLIARSDNNVARTPHNHTILLPTNETSHNTISERQATR